MAELTCQFVRPDKLLYEGTVESLILASADGEYGVWPGHAPEIIALGDGVVRLHMPHPEIYDQDSDFWWIRRNRSNRSHYLGRSCSSR